MKRFAVYIGLATTLVASCSVQEEDFKTPQRDDMVFYASFERPEEEGTRVYANEDLLLRWTADDRVSIFNKNTYNQEYRFIGETGDYEGGFNKVGDPEFITGKEIPHVVSVYPFQRLTRITEEEVVHITLPIEQSYAENSFGLGANTMVSVSLDNLLYYKNVGGYIVIKLYGEGVYVSSITLHGNNGEKLAGSASLTKLVNDDPFVAMTSDATADITLTCETPVQLGATAEESTQFWFVVPPVTFDNGFTVSVTETSGVIFEKSTSRSITIERNKISKMTPIEAERPQPNNVIYYYSSDDKIITPNQNASFGANILTNTYKDGRGTITFDGEVSAIGYMAFYECDNLTKIAIPDSVKGIGDSAFKGCKTLSSINIPDGLTRIGTYSFQDCQSLTSINIPQGVSSIGAYAFYNCSSLESVSLPAELKHIYDQTFFNCRSLIAVDLPSDIESIGMGAFFGCAFESFVFPKRITEVSESVLGNCKSLTSVRFASNAVTTIKNSAFSNCSSLNSIELPDSVTNIGRSAFAGCSSLVSISLPEAVYSISEMLFRNCIKLETVIYGSVVAIKDGAFYGCSNLATIDFNSIYTIGNQAFAQCEKLTAIKLPTTLSSIGYEAFLGCTGLQYFMIETPSIPEISFDVFNDTNDCPIYVPTNSVNSYRIAVNWCDYADRIQAMPPVPVPVKEDLGLSVKWASFNLGASKPEEYGDYYAWGETEPYYSSLDPLMWKAGKESGYNWPSYRWCLGTWDTFTKYCFESDYGYNGFTDGKTFLDPEDDAAHANLGGNWRMPTDEEWTELRENCTWTRTTLNGIYGWKVTSKTNANYIFLPFAGAGGDPNINEEDASGNYWSSTLTDYSTNAWLVQIHSQVIRLGFARYAGLSVRPVCD